MVMKRVLKNELVLVLQANGVIWAIPIFISLVSTSESSFAQFKNYNLSGYL